MKPKEHLRNIQDKLEPKNSQQQSRRRKSRTQDKTKMLLYDTYTPNLCNRNSCRILNGDHGQKQKQTSGALLTHVRQSNVGWRPDKLILALLKRGASRLALIALVYHPTADSTKTYGDIYKGSQQRISSNHLRAAPTKLHTECRSSSNGVPL